MSENARSIATFTITIRRLVAPDALEGTDPETLKQAAADIARDVDQATINLFTTGRTHRDFVCQGCGKVAAVLYGARLKCGCGVTSAAEIMP